MSNPSERGALGSTRGLTMVEVLVVILVLGMAITTIALNLDHVTPTARIFASARELGSMLEYVRNEAIVQKRDLFLIVDLDRQSYRWARAPEIERRGEDLERDSEFSSWKTLLRGVQFEDLTFSDGLKAPDSPAWIPFTANGLPQGVVVHLINEEGRRVSTEINSLTGAVSITDGYKEVERVEDSMFEGR
jgi:Tfp pilus assembly protein FimT